jgi:hypothetical protein
VRRGQGLYSYRLARTSSLGGKLLGWTSAMMSTRCESSTANYDTCQYYLIQNIYGYTHVHEFNICRPNEEQPQRSGSEAAEFEVLLPDLGKDLFVGCDAGGFDFSECYVVLPFVYAKSKILPDWK